LSKAAIIARLDHDDMCYPTRLEKQYNFLEVHPEIGLVGAGIQEIDSEGKKVGSPRIHLSEPYLLKYWLHFEVLLSSPATTFRRSIIEKAGGFNPAAELAEDYDLYTRFVKYCDLSNLSEPLVYKREHGKNASIKYHDDQVARHIHTCESEVAKLMGKTYPYEYFKKLIDREEKLDLRTTQELIRLYYDSSKVFAQKEHLSGEQIKRLQYTVTWRINALLRRCKSNIRFLPTRAKMYWKNHEEEISSACFFYFSRACLRARRQSGNFRLKVFSNKSQFNPVFNGLRAGVGKSLVRAPCRDLQS